MEFTKITLESLLADIAEIPAGWLDEKGQQVLLSVQESIAYLKKMDRLIVEQDLVQALGLFPNFVDVTRLVIGISQDSYANQASEELRRMGHGAVTWDAICNLGKKNPELLANVMVRLELLEILQDQLNKNWTFEGVLQERYRMSRGRAIAGQARGKSLEDEIENGLKVVLDGQAIPYEKKHDFKGFKDRTAKCDFAESTLWNIRAILVALNRSAFSFAVAVRSILTDRYSPARLSGWR
jgi:hypothetical protein